MFMMPVHVLGVTRVKLIWNVNRTTILGPDSQCSERCYFTCYKTGYEVRATTTTIPTEWLDIKLEEKALSCFVCRQHRLALFFNAKICISFCKVKGH